MNNDNSNTPLVFNGKCDKSIYYRLTSRGFFSEINCLLVVCLYCLKEKYRLYIDDSQFIGGVRWDMLFEINESIMERADLGWRQSSITLEIPDALSRQYLPVYKYVRRWWKLGFPLHSQSKNFLPQPVKRAMKNLCQKIYTPRVLLHNADKLIPDLDNFAAIHIRGGDKLTGYPVDGGRVIVEGQKAILSDLLKIVKSKSTPTNTIFLMSDDQNELCMAPDADCEFKIYSLPSSCENNSYFQASFDKLMISEKIASLEALILEVNISTNANLFIGPLRSNVSRFIAFNLKSSSKYYSSDDIRRWYPG